MSLDATVWAWRQSGLSAPQKLVLLSLADRSDEKHICYPSLARLSRDCGIDKRTVMRALDRLGELGIIDRIRSPNKTTHYRLAGVVDRHNLHDYSDRATNSQVGAESHQVGAESHQVGAESHQVGAESHLGRGRVPPESINNLSVTSQESSRSPQAGDHKKKQAADGRAKRGTRVQDGNLPGDWSAWAAANAPDVDAVDQWERFSDYWRAQPGQRGVKLDWSAVWRNWIRRAADGYARKSPQQQRPESSTDRARRIRGNDREWAERERLRREGRV